MGSFEVEEMAKTKLVPVFRILIVLVTLIGLFSLSHKSECNWQIFYLMVIFELGTAPGYGIQITGCCKDGWKDRPQQNHLDLYFSPPSANVAAKITISTDESSGNWEANNTMNGPQLTIYRLRLNPKSGHNHMALVREPVWPLWGHGDPYKPKWANP